MCKKIKERKTFLLPLRGMGYMLYHIAYSKTYEPEIFREFEERYRDLISTQVLTRHAFGGLWAYYKSSMGTLEGLKFWEDTLEKNLD